jgi:multidrug resistance efflux pump
MALDRRFPQRIPVERTKPLLRPDPVPRTKSYEESSATAQAAVRSAGGLQAIVGRISGGFPSATSPGRLTGLQETIASARAELERLDPTETRSDRAQRLRESINGSVRERETLRDQIDKDQRRAAQALVMSAMAGNPEALTMLATHAAKVSPEFEAAIRAANT